MIDISLDKSKAVRIKARVWESSVPKVFVFTNADGSAHDITSYDFKLYVQKQANSQQKLFTLSVGSGLTIQGVGNNELLIEVTAGQATQAATTYFWRLFSVTEDHTWLNGPWEFYNGESDAVIDETPIVISTSGDTVIIEVQGSGVSGSITFDMT